MHLRQVIRWLAVASVALLVLSSCGDDDDDGTASSSEPDATETDEPADEPDDEPADEPDDEPADEPVDLGTVTIGVIYSADNAVYTSESVLTAVESAAAYLNDAGGIDGRPVEVVVCNDLADPNQAVLCSEEMVDADVDFVLSASLFEDGNIPVTTGAGIAHFPTVPNNPAAFTGELVFNITSGVPQIAVGGVVSANAGLETVDMLTLETPVLPLLEGIWSCGLAANGIELGEVIVVPPTTTDWAPFAAQLTSGPTVGVGVILPAFAIVPLGAALDQSDVETQIITPNGTITAENIEQTGGADSPFEGAIVFGPFPSPGNAVWSDFNDAVGSYAPDMLEALTGDQQAQSSWTAIVAVSSVITTELAGADVTAASLSAALSASSAIDTGGLTTPLDFTSTTDGAYGAIRNTSVYLSTVEGGALVALNDDEPVDIADTLASCG